MSLREPTRPLIAGLGPRYEGLRVGRGTVLSSPVVTKLLLIALGGAVGTSLRYGIGIGMVRWLGRGFPFGTLAANILGSFLLGVVMESVGEREVVGVPWKLVLGTGVMGGFTTYSSFNLETIRLAEAGDFGKAGLYLSATLIACVVAGLGGIVLVRSIRGPA